MKSEGRFGSRAGVTLVELLVVVLIIIILSVTILPLLQPFVVKAQYAAEAVPQVGNIRTKIELYRVERSYLPGVMHNASGILQQQAPGTVAIEGGTSHLQADGFLTQGFLAVSVGDLTEYRNAMVNTVAALGTYPGAAELAAATPDPIPNHFAVHTDLDYQDLTGKRLRPDHVHYWTPAAGFNRGAYAYAIGVFGSGSGLPAGTGYAVLEIINPSLNQKHVLTWERWKPVDADAGQITFVSIDEDSTVSAATARDANYCFVPTKAELTAAAADGATFSAMLNDLRTAGWE